MKPFFTYSSVIVACLVAMGVVFSGPPAFGLDSDMSPSADEMRLFDLINAARVAPLDTAASLGMDPDQILKDFPELKDILIQGLAPLNFNESLYASAGGHCRDMLANGYYSYESLDGGTVADRMQDAGYAPAVSGESLGLLYFNNFVSAEEAVSQIFENMFRDELNPEWTGQRNILNPQVKDLGVAMAAGLYTFNGYAGNVYLAACDFGAAMETYDLEMIVLINQARSNPRAVAKFYGMDIRSILKDFPELESLFAKGVPPVMANAQLYASAKGHGADMMANGYYSLISPDGKTPGMRIRDAGYRPVWLAESLARVSTCNVELPPEQTIPRIFKQMFIRAFQSDSRTPDQHMFSDKAMDVGVSTIAGESAALGGICGDRLHITVADYAAGKPGPEFALAGVVYEDANGNGLFDSGEGIANQAVTIKPAGAAGPGQIVYTNSVGGFGRKLANGRYRIAVDNKGATVIRWIEIKDAHAWVTVALQ